MYALYDDDDNNDFVILQMQERIIYSEYWRRRSTIFSHAFSVQRTFQSRVCISTNIYWTRDILCPLFILIE